MKGVLLGVVIAFPVVWVAAVWLLMRQKLNPSIWSLSLSDILNIALFVLTAVSIAIALIGLSIATASYQQAVDAAKKQVEAGEEQSRILQSQAEALDAARRALQEQLVLGREQRAEYLAKLAKRPHIAIEVDAAQHEARIAADKKDLTIELQPGRNAFDFVVVLKNTGDAALQKPLLIFDGRPNRVTFEPRQFGGLNIQDFLPFKQVKKGYRFDVRAIFPQEVDAFQMVLDISGENMDAETTALGVRVVRKPTAPSPQ